MLTKKQIQASNAASFAKILEEVSKVNPKVRDLFWSDHSGLWEINYKDGESAEWETIGEALICIGFSIDGAPSSSDADLGQFTFNHWSEDFYDWAETFFDPLNKHTDRLLTKEYLMDDFRSYSNVPFTTQRFMKSLKFWADKHGYVLNPDELKNSQNRIVRRLGDTRTAKEMLYIRIPGTPINDAL